MEYGKRDKLLESIMVATRLAEADAAPAQQPTQQVAAPAQPAQQPSNSGGGQQVDQAQLEKAFEQALENVKSGIIEEFQNSLNEFGKQLMEKLGKQGGGDDQQKEQPQQQQQPEQDKNQNQNQQQQDQNNKNGGNE